MESWPENYFIENFEIYVLTDKVIAMSNNLNDLSLAFTYFYWLFFFLFRFELIKPQIDFNAFSLWLIPHPLFNPLYGKHFSCLLDNVLSNVYPNSLVITWDKCPKYTVRVTEIIVAKDYDTLTIKDVGLEESLRNLSQHQGQ